MTEVNVEVAGTLLESGVSGGLTGTTRDYPVDGDFFQGVEVSVDGTPRESGIDLAVIRAGERPVDDAAWSAPKLIEGVPGFMTGGRVCGYWQVWTKIEGVSPELPEIYLGTVRLY